MQMSNLLGKTLREPPSEADSGSLALLLRAGYISQLMAGAYTFMPLGNRVRLNIENVVRKYMDLSGAQEILMPALQPIEIWEQSGRAAKMKDVLFRLSDRRGRSLALGPTHEEVVTQLAGKFISSHRDLPLTTYQIQTKFRDEARPRGGLVRVREFTMKDAYSFDLDEDGLSDSYDKMFQAYKNIFSECGVPVVPVEADSGAIGGKGSQEFIFITEMGEDTVVRCSGCEYAANLEKATFLQESSAEAQKSLEEVETPNVATIEDLSEFLSIANSSTAKAVLFMATKFDSDEEFPVLAVIRGDFEVNDVKLSNALGGAELRPMEAPEAANVGLVPGYISPVNLASEVTVVADRSVISATNLAGGANRDGWHYLNTNYGRDWEADIVTDLAEAQEGLTCEQCDGGILSLARGIEMGHVFRLGQIYAEAFGVSIQDSDGAAVTPTMGCYGIGIGRIFAAAAEVFHDDKGLSWPIAIAPYQVHLVAIGIDKDDAVRDEAYGLYAELTESGIDVLFDDRALRPGVMFNDADLMGMPIRVTVSPRNHENEIIEITGRADGESLTAPRAEGVDSIKAEIHKLQQG